MARGKDEVAIGVNVDVAIARRIEGLRREIQGQEMHRKVHTSEVIRLLLLRGLDRISGEDDGEEGQ